MRGAKQAKVAADAASYLERLDQSITRMKTAVAQEKAILRIKLNPGNSREKIELIARAYALSRHFKADEDVVRLLAKKYGKSTPVADPARLFLEVLCPLSNEQAPKTYSRWAKVVGYLKDNYVLPSEVEALRQSGGGIDKWTRGGKATKVPSPKKDLKQPVVVTIVKGATPTHWNLWSSSQVEAVERALQSIAPEPLANMKIKDHPKR